MCIYIDGYYRAYDDSGDRCTMHDSTSWHCTVVDRPADIRTKQIDSMHSVYVYSVGLNRHMCVCVCMKDRDGAQACR